jgi:hypothetical protein
MQGIGGEVRPCEVVQEDDEELPINAVPKL